MKTSKYLFVIIFPLILLRFGTAQAQDNLAQEVYTIFQQNCLLCHGEHGSFTEDLIIDRAALIASGTIVPRNPNASEFLKRLIEDTPEKPRMPWGQPALSDDAIQTIRLWIQAGAPDWEVQYDVNFITTDAMLDTIQAHLEGLSAFDRPSARYFTLTHLYNAGESPEALDAYKIALSKLVNSLSWGFDVINPQPIDLQETIFYIDLRHYEWDVRNEAWTQIEREYPYSIDFDPETQAGLHEKLTHLRTEMACEVPFVHVDWFLANASLPPLYHDILDLPETDRELEQQLEVNVTRNIDSAPGVRVWRAGFNDSGVSNNNRVVERHTSRYGAYWKSYDFAGSVGQQNIFTHPLTFRADGGEVVFNLPNGLQAYYISDASGNRIDEAPTNIVSNPAASNPAVRNGLSCIGCHTEGMKTFEDEVRAVVEKAPDGPVKDQGLRLYVEQSVMDDLVEEDTERYRAALEKTGGVFGGIEPVHRFHEEFQGPVDALHAAAAVGLETETFLQEILDKQRLRSLGLAGLLEGGDVNRDAWTSNFAQVISALNAPGDTTTRPVEPVTDLRPGDLVSIPDPNLRTVIEQLLGKAPNALITAADMARLTRIDADDAGISNLTGLEAVTELERIEFRRNSISDLSPLRGLTQLNNIKLRGNRITDVSPLAGLINVDWLGLEENEITDLSPLKGLIKLNGIGISGNPVSDVSPLAGLISLERIDAWRTPISDFSPLARLPRLSWIEFGNDRSIAVLPSLKGLKNLRRLEINDCNISDISGLAELTRLQRLELINNQMSDISPLENLKSLEHLNLDANIISDVSPLANLTRLKVLYLENNQISDVSPLAGLTNLERLDLRNNAISDFSPLDGLSEKTIIRSQGNPSAVLQGGAKIVGPWLWVVLPGEGFHNGRDLLAQASGGKMTELSVATDGATEGEPVGSNVWTSHKIDPNGANTRKLVRALGVDDSHQHRVMYGSIILRSDTEQQTTMFAGSDNDHKVWLNGKLVNEKLDGNWATDYQQSFPVRLKQGKNVLLVAVFDYEGGWGGAAHFGFAPDTEYTILPPGSRFSFSTAATQVKVGDRFTIQLSTENISDLAGWQGDITFDPAVLKVNNVSEGSFLKQGGGRTHFLKGTIDNTTGRIDGVGSARISEGGVSGKGTLLSVTFTAIANGESRLSLRKFQAGSSLGETISSRPPDIIITVGDPSVSDVSDDLFSLSTDADPIRMGDTFTLRLNANDVTDLAGWQTDISFDPALLEAVEVSEGDFLKAKSGDTFFLQGFIDNTAGKITGISTAKLKGSGSGTGTLLLVTFKAKAAGETRVTLSNFYAGSSSGEAIPSDAPEIVIIVEDREYPAWDVNQDGQVNVLDLILVAQYLGEDAASNPQVDVNGDGIINILDLIIVAQYFGESTEAAAPFYVAAIDSLELDPAMIRTWIAQAEAENDGSLVFRQGIANLQRLLALLLPKKTALLANYPNPFNPETWIPYHLAEPADVRVRIYAADGVLVRTLALGHQVAGIYENRTRAAYWDGKNEVGEPVASGVYFYTLSTESTRDSVTAGDFMTTRKMLIRK
ncbi:hypothetical protein F4Z99_07200 [Candidatus Poribacteria bacterium]|nr:hypothetical protein [Candidatus Poribacteria bacterium]